MNRLPIVTPGIGLALGLLLCAAPVRAEEPAAGPAPCPATEAWTVFVTDATLRRHDGSARRITQAHREAEQRGGEFRDLEVYTENGDLQGFFITYTRPHPCNG
jgi:hypothetical protein